jgi:sulfoxide reductase heme-binding subunit YedZ
VDWLQIATHVGALTPLAVLAWMFWQGRLGPVPVAAVTRRLGRYALVLLLLSLVPTVLRLVTGVGAVIRVRRWVGLYAFLYGVLHFLAFAGLDYGFDLGLIARVVLESRREIVGLAALAILGLLALTSIPELVRRLGKTWKPLHRLVYVAAALVVLHYLWNYKALRRWPVMAAVALLLLLVPRLPPVARFLSQRRQDEPGSAG